MPAGSLKCPSVLGEVYGNSYLVLVLPTMPPSWTGASTILLLLMKIVLAYLLEVMHEKQPSMKISDLAEILNTDHTSIDTMV